MAGGTADGRGFVGRKAWLRSDPELPKMLSMFPDTTDPSETAADDGNPATGVLIFWREFSGKFGFPSS